MAVCSGALVRRRQLARILREMRQKAGFTIEAAAPRLDFSPSKLSRIENAHQGVDVHVVRTMMDVFGVGGDRWNEVLDLTREASAKGWWRAYGLDDHGMDDLAWRKSSFSGSGGNSTGCVEVAPLSHGGVAVRDTKDRSRAAHRHSAPAWQAFLTAIRTGEFDDPEPAATSHTHH